MKNKSLYEELKSLSRKIRNDINLWQKTLKAREPMRDQIGLLIARMEAEIEAMERFDKEINKLLRKHGEK